MRVSNSHLPLCVCFRWAGDCVPSGGKLPQHHQQQHVFLGPAGPLCQNRVSQQGGDGRRTETGPQSALHVVRVWHPETRTPLYSQVLPSWGGPNLAEHLQGGHCAAPLSQGREHKHTMIVMLEPHYQRWKGGVWPVSLCQSRKFNNSEPLRSWHLLLTKLDRRLFLIRRGKRAHTHRNPNTHIFERVFRLYFRIFSISVCDFECCSVESQDFHSMVMQGQIKHFIFNTILSCTTSFYTATQTLPSPNYIVTLPVCCVPLVENTYIHIYLVIHSRLFTGYIFPHLLSTCASVSFKLHAAVTNKCLHVFWDICDPIILSRNLIILFKLIFPSSQFSECTLDAM